MANADVWLPLLTRAATTALLVVSASAIAEAAGPFWGALIASLPVSVGPAYVFLAMQHGADFIAASALSSFAANAATGLFLIVYGVLAVRLAPWPSLGYAILAWLAAAAATQQVNWTPLTALLLNVAIYGGGFVVLNTSRSVSPQPLGHPQRRWFDHPVRALVVALFVTLVVAISSALGPNATGIAAVFPISLTSLIAIVRPRIGGPASSLLAANALRSMLGHGMMLLALHLSVRPWGLLTAFVIALLTTVFWSSALLALRRRHLVR